MPSGTEGALPAVFYGEKRCGHGRDLHPVLQAGGGTEHRPDWRNSLPAGPKKPWAVSSRLCASATDADGFLLMKSEY